MKYLTFYILHGHVTENNLHGHNCTDTTDVPRTFYHAHNKVLIFFVVYRIHWLCACVQRNRWSEELNLTEHEMEWTVHFYMYMAKLWASRRDANSGDPGLRTYAEQIMDM